MVIFYKDIYREIEKFIPIKNIYNFLHKNQKINYTCELCGNMFHSVSTKNKMCYELEYFNNNLLFNKDRVKIDINMNHYFLLNNIDIKLCKYKKINQLFCNVCMLNINKRTSRFNYCDYGICNYISEKHYQFIKLNNGFFIQDSISDNRVIIKRYFYNFLDNENNLLVNSLYLNDRKEVIDLLATEKEFEKIKIMIEGNFNLNFKYLNLYLKDKTI